MTRTIINNRKFQKDESSSSSSSSNTESDSETTTSTTDSTSEDTSTVTSESEDSPTENEKSRGGKLTRKKVNREIKTIIQNGKAGKKKRRLKQITICLTHCRYEVVRKIAHKYNLREVGEDQHWNIYWTDYSVSLERVTDMRRYQIINHFPGMNEICRKDLLARNLNRMKKLFPKEYDIYPKTWSLPADLGDLQTYAHARRNKTFICKPEMGCQGRGIFLIRNIKDLNPFGKIICQLYIARPFLIDELKFDLRIYALITSCDPLRVWLYKEGLARFATAKYKPPTSTNTENSYMHLTNYAVNKFSRDFVVDDEAGSKRKLSSVYRWLESRNYNVEALIESIDSVILKTIISAHPVLRHNYRTCFPNHEVSACFEILGFDILFDHKLKPYVLEVNHSPSFHTDSRLDMEIKEGLLNDTMNMLNFKRLDRHKVQNDERKRVQERLFHKTISPQLNAKKASEKMLDNSAQDNQFAFEIGNSGGFRLIYPTPTSEKYDTFFEQNLSSIYQETAASQARTHLTRTHIAEMNHKRQIEEIKRLPAKGVKEAVQAKEKVRPESPADSSTNFSGNKAFKKGFINNSKSEFPVVTSSFHPGLIDPVDELSRTKGIMQRGILIRSLGIEMQVFQLLSQVGTIKPEEEKLFKKLKGIAEVPPPTVPPRTAVVPRFYQQTERRPPRTSVCL